jgi:hypothetical protein
VTLATLSFAIAVVLIIFVRAGLSLILQDGFKLQLARFHLLAKT